MLLLKPIGCACPDFKHRCIQLKIQRGGCSANLNQNLWGSRLFGQGVPYFGFYWIFINKFFKKFGFIPPYPSHPLCATMMLSRFICCCCWNQSVGSSSLNKHTKKWSIWCCLWRSVIKFRLKEKKTHSCSKSLNFYFPGSRNLIFFTTNTKDLFL